MEESMTENANPNPNIPSAGPPGPPVAAPPILVDEQTLAQLAQLGAQMGIQPATPAPAEPGFWTRSTENIGEQMFRTAVDTLVAAGVLGVIYLAKVGVQMLIFPKTDDTV
jgi:hypothetical protein